ncbi:MAG: DUF4349 domain-containing protein [Acidimicrobiia bacterium]
MEHQDDVGTDRSESRRAVHRRVVRAFAAVVLVAVAASCSGSEDDSAARSDSADEPTPATGAPAAEEESSDATATGGAASPEVAPASLADRSIIRTAAMTVAVSDVEAAAASVTTVAAGVGGAVHAAELRLEEPPSATMVVRMPPEQLQSAIDQVAALGRVVNRTQDSADVTAQVVDLAARIASAEASVDRVRGFLERAQNVTELAALEAELTARETTLEQLRAQQRTLTDQVDLATLTITLVNAEDQPEISLVGLVETSPPSILNAFSAGARALVTGVRFVAIAVAAALPFIAVLGLIALPLRVWLRRRRAAGVARSPLPPPTL